MAVCPQDYYFLNEVKDDPICDYECLHCQSGWTKEKAEEGVVV